MGHFVLRVLGALLLAGGVATLLIDGAGSLTASRLVVASLQQTVGRLGPSVLTIAQADVAHIPPALVWPPMLDLLLGLPTCLALGGTGLVLWLAGQPRAPAIGDVRR